MKNYSKPMPAWLEETIAVMPRDNPDAQRAATTSPTGAGLMAGLGDAAKSLVDLAFLSDQNHPARQALLSQIGQEQAPYNVQYEPYSADWVKYNLLRMAPTSLGLGAAAGRVMASPQARGVAEMAKQYALRKGASPTFANVAGELVAAGLPGTMAATPEAMLEGQQAEEEVLRSGGTPEMAADARRAAIGLNLVWLPLTNTLEIAGAFGKFPAAQGGLMRKAAVTAGRTVAPAPGEAIQEGGQQIIQQAAEGQQINPLGEDVMQAAALGGLSALPFGAMGAAGRYMQDRAAARAQNPAITGQARPQATAKPATTATESGQIPDTSVQTSPPPAGQLTPKEVKALDRFVEKRLHEEGAAAEEIDFLTQAREAGRYDLIKEYRQILANTPAAGVTPAPQPAPSSSPAPAAAQTPPPAPVPAAQEQTKAPAASEVPIGNRTQIGAMVVPQTSTPLQKPPKNGKVEANKAVAPAPAEQPPADLGTAPADASDKLADWVHGKFGEKGGQVNAKELIAKADETFGGTMAENRYTVKDMYDSLELGVNKWLAGRGSQVNVREDAGDAVRVVKGLKAAVSRLPTQTNRTGEMQEFQQFSTPPHYAYVAAWVANITARDTVLEPSAGVGGLATFAKLARAKEVIVNELSARRAALLEKLGFDKVYTENAEQLDNILPDGVKPSVVIMNPPFSSTAGRVPGAKDTANAKLHIEQALARLAPGGRLVAILGRGMADDSKTFGKWWDGLRDKYTIRANIGVDGKEYAKYGTSFGNQIVVIDKTGPQEGDTITGQVSTVEELVPKLEGVRRERQPFGSTVPQQDAAQPGGEEDADAGQGADRDGQPARVPADEVRPGQRGRGGEEPGGRRAAAERDSGDGRGRPQEGHAVSDQRPGRGRDNIADSGRPGHGTVAPGRGAARSQGARNGVVQRPASGVSREVRDVVGITVETVKDAAPVKTELSDSIYEDYRPQKAKVQGAKPHPGKLVQSAAMAAVEPPDPTYSPKLSKAVVEKGLLSAAQLEAIIYAGQAHSQTLPNGNRKGFFIGDGTGVGKGREIAGIIEDNWNNGRKKALWLSSKWSLFEDAKRDVSDIGSNPNRLFRMKGLKVGEAVKPKEGVLFATYSTVAKKAQAANKARSREDRNYPRIDQIKAWLGEDFEGVIVFDEAHKMANSTDRRGERGVREASDMGRAGLILQAAFPKARIVYASATGATELDNILYADRLGLWGEGTPFADRENFVEKIAQGGIAAMELVSRDMKAMGVSIVRNLSFDGVTYGNLVHELTEDQRGIYDALAEAWQVVLQNIHKAAELTNSSRGKNSKHSNAMSQFWGYQQRFFNQVLMSMQVPSVIEDIRQQIAAGNAPVVQLVNTNEAAMKRALSERDEDESLDDLDLTPSRLLTDMIERCFPTQQYEERVDEQGNKAFVPVVDSKGNPVHNREALALKDAMLKKVGAARVPEGALDQIINAFGTEKVAEVTGRSERVVWGYDSKTKRKAKVVEKRGPGGASANARDVKAFLDGKKDILVFSDAGGTGSSYHSDTRFKNQKRRIHYLVQPGWRADNAVQGFGRTHRSNEANQPHYFLVSTDVKGQKRFLATIARRLDQLGALTKGERKTGSQGLFDARDNLESGYGQRSVHRFFYDLFTSREVNGFTFDDLTKRMGFTALVDTKTGELIPERIPTVRQFLNRMLALDVKTQNRLFDEFSSRMDESIEAAVVAGTLDKGLETLKAESVAVAQERTVYTDPATKSETKYVELDVTNSASYVQFAEAKGGKKFYGFYRNKQSGKLWAMHGPYNETDLAGRVVTRYRAVSPNSTQYVPEHAMGGGFEQVKEAEARKLWQAALDKLPAKITEKLHIMTGTLLPIWDRLLGHPRVMRVQTDDGRRMLGRIVPGEEVNNVLRNLGAAENQVKLTPKQLMDKVLNDNQGVILSNNWLIGRRVVNGQPRIELLRWAFSDMRRLEEMGLFTEWIQNKTRAFIPTSDKGMAVIEKLLKYQAIVEVGPFNAGAAGMYYSTSGSAVTPRQLQMSKVERQNLSNAERLAVELGRALGTKVDIFQHTDAGLRGVYVNGRSWINRNADINPAWVLGHEWTHWLADNRPELYARLADAVGDMERQMDVLLNYAERHDMLDKSTQEVEQEIIADQVGNAFNRPSFWQKVYDQAPELFRQLVDALRDMLATVKAYIKREKITGLLPSQIEALERELRAVIRVVVNESDAYAPIFASKLRGAVEAMQDKFTAEQLLGRLAKAGVKADELRWSGIELWAREQKGAITKEAALAYLDEHGVNLEEVWHTRPDTTRYNQYVTSRSNYRELLLTLPGPAEEGKVYRTSHWNEPNVVAHARMSDTTDDAGRGVLVVEEVQSDWHQEGRRKGYWQPPNDRVRELREIERRRALTDEELDELVSLDQQGINTLVGKSRGVPPAPFSKTWHELVMKRMLRLAAEEGYDRLAWTSGAVQADRYDLSKHIKGMTYEVNKMKDIYPVRVWFDLAGGEPMNKIFNNRQEVENFLGKEVADKMEARTGRRRQAHYGGAYQYHMESLDLKVGGEGMRGFYDKMLPAFMERYLRQWNKDAKVERMKLPDGKVLHVVNITPQIRAGTLESSQMLFSREDGPTAAENLGTAQASALERLRRQLHGEDAGAPPPGRLTIITKKHPRNFGIVNYYLRSVSYLADKFPSIRVFFNMADDAMQMQERLRASFRERLDNVHRTLGHGTFLERLAGQADKGNYEANKRQLYEILWRGDEEQKYYNERELREMGANDEVVRAYRLIRTAMDHAYSIVKNTREIRDKLPPNYLGGYIPHFFHEWFIMVDGEMYGSARTQREAAQIGKKLLEENPGAQVLVKPKTFRFPGAEMQAAILGDKTYIMFENKLEETFGEEGPAFLDEAAMMRPRSRHLGQLMHRKGVPGWEKNLDWVLIHHFNMVSRYAALDRFKSKSISIFERMYGAFDKEYTGLPKYVKDFVNDMNGVPSEVENVLNNSLNNSWLGQYLGRYMGNRPSLQIATAITDATAILKLGLYNISTGLIQASQFMNIYAKLGNDAFVGLSRAFNPHGSYRGVLKQAGVEHTLGLESGAGYSNAGQLYGIFKKSTYLFKVGDIYLRRAAALGAYNKAIREGKTPTEAVAYAKRINRITNYEYGVQDAPNVFRRGGPVAQVLLQFKKYPIKTLELMANLRGWEIPRFWVPFIVVSGYFGFPFVGLFGEIVRKLFDIDLEKEGKRYLMTWAGADELRQALARAIMYGALGTWPGVDISRRVGAGDYVPSQLSDFLGPSITSAARTVQQLSRANWIEAVRATAPALGNLVVAAAGERTGDRGRVVTRYESMGETAAKALGFMPVDEAIERDKTGIIRYMERGRRTAEQEAIDRYLVNPTPENANKLRELKISPQRVQEEREKKKKIAIERQGENVPKKRRSEYDAIKKFD